MDSAINTTKNGETKIYKAVQELQSLVKMNNEKDRSIGGKQYPKHNQISNRENLRRRKKIEEDLDYFLHNNASQKKKKYVTKKINSWSTTRIKARRFLTKISYNSERRILWPQKTSIPSLWREKCSIWKTEKRFRCFAKSVKSPVFINTFASQIILCI